MPFEFDFFAEATPPT